MQPGAGFTGMRRKKLLLIKQYAQEDSPVRDLVGAWRLLQQLREPALTGRQRERCLRDRIYVAMELGNMPEAEQLIDSCLENPAAGGETAYYFYKNVLCLKQGRWEEAAVHARKAEASCGTRTDPLMAAQIIHNRAVSFVARGEYRNADKDFREALQRLSAGERGGAAAFFFGFVAHGKRRAEKRVRIFRNRPSRFPGRQVGSCGWRFRRIFCSTGFAWRDGIWTGKLRSCGWSRV